MAKDPESCTWGSDTGERLVKLETHMQDLVGNGQPGRVNRIETEVKEHGKYLWLGLGGLGALEFVLHVFSDFIKIAK